MRSKTKTLTVKINNVEVKLRLDKNSDINIIYE